MTQITIKKLKSKAPQIDRDLLNRESTKIGRSISELLRTQARRTVQTWENKPIIKTERRTQKNAIIVKLMIEQWAVDIWKMLDEGTEPHTITPDKANFLVFRQEGFVAKTKPGIFSAGAGAAATGDLQFRKKVKHPGNEARKWSEMMQERAEKKIDTLTQEAMKRIAQNGGAK